jgi:hypothetical protein
VLRDHTNPTYTSVLTLEARLERPFTGHPLLTRKIEIKKGANILLDSKPTGI